MAIGNCPVYPISPIFLTTPSLSLFKSHPASNIGVNVKPVIIPGTPTR